VSRRRVPLLYLATAIAALGAPAAPARAATLVYSNDVLGEIEPCGCRENPLGGMLRKANLLKKSEDPSLLQVDAGDLLFDSAVVAPALQKQARLQAGYVLKSLDLLGHDAVSPGEKDFALGVKTFNELRARSKVKFLAANLKRRDGAKFLEPSAAFLRKTKDGRKLRIAVIGVVGAELDWPRELKATPAIEAVRAEVRRLRNSVDRVVVLSHQGLEADQKLAQAVPGIDYIVGGHTQAFLQEPPKSGTAVIFQSSFRNQYVGLVSMDEAYQAEKHRLVGLDPGYEDEHPMKALVTEFKAAVAKLNSEEAEKATLTRLPSDQPLFHTFPRCAECHLKQFDFWRKTKHADALSPLLAQNQLRNKDCLACHTVGFGVKQGWKELGELASREDKPLAVEELAGFMKQVHDAGSLKDSVKITRADPLPIPIRGALPQLTRAFAPVQCENCHQPGADHPFSGKYAKTVAIETCLKCHTPERAPAWHKDGKPDRPLIEKKLESVKCPAGELSEDEL
jgi:hypothetical protein